MSLRRPFAGDPIVNTTLVLVGLYVIGATLVTVAVHLWLILLAVAVLGAAAALTVGVLRELWHRRRDQ